MHPLSSSTCDCLNTSSIAQPPVFSPQRGHLDVSQGGQEKTSSWQQRSRSHTQGLGRVMGWTKPSDSQASRFFSHRGPCEARAASKGGRSWYKAASKCTARGHHTRQTRVRAGRGKSAQGQMVHLGAPDSTDASLSLIKARQRQARALEDKNPRIRTPLFWYCSPLSSSWPVPSIGGGTDFRGEGYQPAASGLASGGIQH